ncbi:MAG: TIR domain-containing protein [Chloroflexota bacterium]
MRLDYILFHPPWRITIHEYLSHATADDDFVTALRQQLELHNIQTWVDSRNLRGGDKLHSQPALG